MENQKIFNTDEINWAEKEEHTPIDYQLPFENSGDSNRGRKKRNAVETEDASEDRRVDVKALRKRRDAKWEKRLEKARKNAFAEGLEKGKKIGHAKAKEQINNELEGVEQIIRQGHEEWIQRQKKIAPAILDLIFEIVEKIVGLPIENPEMKETLEEELTPLMYEVNRNAKPILRVSQTDYDYVKGLVEKYAPEVSVNIQVDHKYNPGEFEFETDKETVVYRFKEILNEFREKLSLPSWK